MNDDNEKDGERTEHEQNLSQQIGTHTQKNCTEKMIKLNSDEK